MAGRTPTPKEVGDLPPDDWERLCTALLAKEDPEIHRVEDRKGKGNGLDCWKEEGDGIHGWQHRRLEKGLNDAQIEKLKDAIKLAKDRAPRELGKPLKRVTAVLNIDLEAGHDTTPKKGKKNAKAPTTKRSGAKPKRTAKDTGELGRFNDLKKWAKDELDVEVDHRGRAWAHTNLLKHPELKPELFEDVVAEVKEIKERVDASQRAVVDRVETRSREVEDAVAAATADIRRDLAAMAEKLEQILKFRGVTFTAPPPAQLLTAADSVLLLGALATFEERVTPAKDRWSRHWYLDSIPALQDALKIREASGSALYQRARHWLWAAYLEAALVLRDPNWRRAAWQAADDLAPGAEGLESLRRGPAWEVDIGSAYQEALSVVYYALSLEFQGKEPKSEALLLAHAATCRRVANASPASAPLKRLTDEVLDGLVGRGLLAEEHRRPIPVNPTPTALAAPIPLIKALEWECARCHRVKPIAFDSSPTRLETLTCDEGHSLKDAYGFLTHLIRDRLRLGQLTHALVRLEGRRAQEHRLVPSNSFAVQTRFFERLVTFPVFDEISLQCAHCARRFSVNARDLSKAHLNPQINCAWCGKANEPIAIDGSQPIVDLNGKPIPGKEVGILARDQLSDVHEYNAAVRDLANWEQSAILSRYWDALGRLQFTVEKNVAIVPPPQPQF